MSDDIRIRRLAAGDWDGVVALEERAYAASGLSEGRAALESRGRASPGSCFALEYRGRFGGYLLALPYPLYRCPDLSRSEEQELAQEQARTQVHAQTQAQAQARTNMHAHDLVIAEELRGRGLAPLMLDHLAGTARAQGYATISLVAVRGSEVLWAPLGYRANPEVVLPKSYGDRALYMSMPLGPHPGTARAAAPATAPATVPAGTTGHTNDPLAGSPPRVEVG
ncbi:N-acetyltransferase [Streptomyces sp. CB01881]|uniref:GNAT family N-acetyltransferase n=1 Tax=Streptomyces sp. CB01881 TaxID=2078691 RepID=UPI0011E03556|nr:GNAT family N-acetyltransferase [Streptomyces sp. CB01881]TYC68325.1 N-acetyltransferase [Streptomyces sp. CB01881]